jgi:hypothetical protein
MLSQPKLYLNNKTALLKNNEPYKVHILLGKKFISLATTDKKNKNITILKHFENELNNINKSEVEKILSDDLIKNAVEVNIGMDTTKHTLIPSSLFDEKEKESYLTTQFSIDSSEVVLHHKISNDITSLFAIKQSSFLFLNSMLNNVHFYHAASTLIKSYPLYLLKDNKYNIFISTREDFSTITIFDDNNLIYHHIYEINSSQDTLYYVFNYLETSGIDFSNCVIQYHGKTKLNTELQNLFQPYFRIVKPISRIKQFNYMEELYAQPSNYFFNLLSIISCES